MQNQTKFDTRSSAGTRRGFVISSELILVGVVVVIGLIVGVVSIRNSVVAELSDVAGAVQDANQSFSVNGSSSPLASTAGSDFSDAIDAADSPGDPAGAADNGILFDVAPSDESNTAPPSDPPTSDPGTFSFASTPVGGPITGSIGDGTIDTGFTTTSSGNAQITGASGNEIVFSEDPADDGSFTTTFDDPLTEVEFFVSSLANTGGGSPHILGNFTVTLSDGTVINNAAFSIVPDAISPSTAIGSFFTTQALDSDPLVALTSGGNNFVYDGNAAGGGGTQAAGRIRFTNPLITGAAADVGISSVTFDRSGGDATFGARFSFSGRVIDSP